jgi:hypothetical protein
VWGGVKFYEFKSSLDKGSQKQSVSSGGAHVMFQSKSRLWFRLKLSKILD